MWRLLTHKSYHIIHIHSCEFSHCKVPVLWLGTRQTWACIRGNPRFWVLFCFSQSVISLNVWGVGKCLSRWVAMFYLLGQEISVTVCLLLFLPFPYQKVNARSIPSSTKPLQERYWTWKPWEFHGLCSPSKGKSIESSPRELM